MTRIPIYRRVTIDPEPCCQCGQKAILFGYFNPCSGRTRPLGVCIRCLCAAVGIWQGCYPTLPKSDADYRHENLLMASVRDEVEGIGNRSSWLHRLRK